MRVSRVITTSVLTGAVLLGTASPALAWDCFNGSRSAQGNVQAANSKNWWSVPEFLVVAGGLTQEQVAAIMPVVNADPRVPANFTIFFNEQHPSELAMHMREDLATNGKGIEHSDDYADPILEAIIEDALSVLAAS